MIASSFALQLTELRDRKDALILAECCLSKLLTDGKHLATAKKSAVSLNISTENSFHSVAVSLRLENHVSRVPYRVWDTIRLDHSP